MKKNPFCLASGKFTESELYLTLLEETTRIHPRYFFLRLLNVWLAGNEKTARRRI